MHVKVWPQIFTQIGSAVVDDMAENPIRISTISQKFLDRIGWSAVAAAVHHLQMVAHPDGIMDRLTTRITPTDLDVGSFLELPQLVIM